MKIDSLESLSEDLIENEPSSSSDQWMPQQTFKCGWNICVQKMQQRHAAASDFDKLPVTWMRSGCDDAVRICIGAGNTQKQNPILFSRLHAPFVSSPGLN